MRAVETAQGSSAARDSARRGLTQDWTDNAVARGVRGLLLEGGLGVRRGLLLGVLGKGRAQKIIRPSSLALRALGGVCTGETCGAWLEKTTSPKRPVRSPPCLTPLPLQLSPLNYLSHTPIPFSISACSRVECHNDESTTIPVPADGLHHHRGCFWVRPPPEAASVPQEEVQGGRGGGQQGPPGAAGVGGAAKRRRLVYQRRREEEEQALCALALATSLVQHSNRERAEHTKVHGAAPKQTVVKASQPRASFSGAFWRRSRP